MNDSLPMTEPGMKVSPLTETVNITWTEMTLKKTGRDTHYPLEVYQCGGVYWIYWASKKLLKIGKTNNTIACRLQEHTGTHGKPDHVFYMAIEDKRRQHVVELSLKKAISRNIIRGNEWAKVKCIDSAKKMMSGISVELPTIKVCVEHDKVVGQAVQEMPIVQLSNHIQELTEYIRSQSVQIEILNRKLAAYRIAHCQSPQEKASRKKPITRPTVRQGMVIQS